MTPNPGTEDARKHLELLCEAVERYGLTAWVISPRHGGRPRLHVVNEQAPTLTEKITVSDAGWFVWSWGEGMIPVDQVEHAAQRVSYVLTPRDP